MTLKLLNTLTRLKETLKPIQKKRNALLKDKHQIFDILKEGAEKAIEVTYKTMEEVRGKIGFL